VNSLVTHVLASGHDRIETARLLIEQVTLHECAHALLGEDNLSAEQVGTLLGRVRAKRELGQSAAQQRQQHHDRWAAALLILTDRALKYRPRFGDLLAVLSHDQIEGYGHSVSALRRVIGPVDDDAPISQLLADSGPLTARLRAAGQHRPPDQHADQHGAVAAAGVF
jgi:hypothetical protein